eukprot:COSAG06_NODE_1946_length_8005_cov_5.434986_10_plen_180_part_01
MARIEAESARTASCTRSESLQHNATKINNMGSRLVRLQSSNVPSTWQSRGPSQRPLLWVGELTKKLRRWHDPVATVPCARKHSLILRLPHPSSTGGPRCTPARTPTRCAPPRAAHRPHSPHLRALSAPRGSRCPRSPNRVVGLNNLPHAPLCLLRSARLVRATTRDHAALEVAAARVDID